MVAKDLTPKEEATGVKRRLLNHDVDMYKKPLITRRPIERSEQPDHLIIHPYFCECRPNMLPSVSIASEMKPYSPIGILDC